jgi:uncharacterized protein (TIGR02246 family)
MSRRNAFNPSHRRGAALLLGIFVVVTLLCGSALGQQKAAATAGTRAADEKALRDTDTAYSNAATAKDLEKCVSNYADNAVVMVAGEPARTGKAAIHEFLDKTLKTPGLSLSWQVTKVQVARSGELGYTRGVTISTTTDASGKKETTKGKYVTVWNKMPDGSWKAVADISNDDVPPKPPAPAKKR